MSPAREKWAGSNRWRNALLTLNSSRSVPDTDRFHYVPTDALVFGNALWKKLRSNRRDPVTKSLCHVLNDQTTQLCEYRWCLSGQVHGHEPHAMALNCETFIDIFIDRRMEKYPLGRR